MTFFLFLGEKAAPTRTQAVGRGECSLEGIWWTTGEAEPAHKSSLSLELVSGHGSVGLWQEALSPAEAREEVRGKCHDAGVGVPSFRHSGAGGSGDHSEPDHQRPPLPSANSVTCTREHPELTPAVATEHLPRRTLRPESQALPEHSETTGRSQTHSHALAPLCPQQSAR